MLRCSVVAFAKATARKGGAASRAAAAAASGQKTSDAPAPKELAKASKARRAAGKLRFDDYKAGLQKVDKAHVEQVIQEASKGSPFYLKEQRKEEARREKIEAVLKKAEEYAALSPTQKYAIRERVDALEARIEATRDVRRRYIHVDMDMFYASVEEKKNPSLSDVPFGVGSLQMLATTNYIARQYGVRSGMPGFIGKKLCPDLLIVPTDFASYRREAATAHSIAARYDPNFVSLGLDELTMDVTDYLKEFPYLTPAQVATDFRDEVFAKTQLSCSGGIAPTPTLAKIASNINKPNGQHEITLLDRDDFLRYVKDIPVGKIPGIGYAQESMLSALGIRICGDMRKNKYLLAYLFKEKTFEYYLAVGIGLMGAGNAHNQHTARQSIGKEVSFSEPLQSADTLARLFRKLIEPCHAQCVRERLHAQQMRLLLKYRSYDTQQFSIALPRPTNDLKLWLEAAKKLLAPHLEDYSELRLVGVRLQKFVGEAELSQHNSSNNDDEDGSAEEAQPVEVRPRGGSNGSSAFWSANARPLAPSHPSTDETDKFDDDEDEHHRALDDKIDDGDNGETPSRGSGRGSRAAASSSSSYSSASKKIKAAAAPAAKTPLKRRR